MEAEEILWVTIRTFELPQHAYIAKARLEASGLEVQLLNEHLAQTMNWYSGAIGGVQLQCLEADKEDAIQQLIDGGFLSVEIAPEDTFFDRLQRKSANWPLLGSMEWAPRLFSLVALVLVLSTIPLVIYLTPSDLDYLQQESWCIEMSSYTLPEVKSELTFYFERSCDESISFRPDLTIDHPAAFGYSFANWTVEDDYLIISNAKEEAAFLNGRYHWKMNARNLNLT